MQLSSEVKISLEREYSLCTNALAFYKKALQDFEAKYNLSTKAFLNRFETGEMGDDADFFEWYSFAKLLSQWRKTQQSLRSLIR